MRCNSPHTRQHGTYARQSYYRNNALVKMDVGGLLLRLLRLILVATVAACLSVNNIPMSFSPRELGLRPAPAYEEMPALYENPNRLYDPMPSELNTTLLRVKLGKNLDPNFMSIVRPRENQEFFNDSKRQFRRTKKGRLVPVGEMPKYLLDLDHKFIYLPNGDKLRTRWSPKQMKKVRQYLWTYTRCPVAYRWKDLGQRFWPRWLKEGFCPAGKTSCSIPPGMKCRPDTAVYKTILRFLCMSKVLSNAANEPQERVCHWIKVEYPVVTKCTCSCNSCS